MHQEQQVRGYQIMIHVKKRRQIEASFSKIKTQCQLLYKVPLLKNYRENRPIGRLCTNELII